MLDTDTVTAAPAATAPAWAAALGGVAVLCGVLLAAAQGHEALAQRVLAPDSAAARSIPADCRRDEAAQEGVSVAECELMVANVRITLASRPPWFRGVQSALALAGTAAALASIGVGLALVASSSPNMDAVTPMPAARVSTASTVYRGCRSRIRMECATSLMASPLVPHGRISRPQRWHQSLAGVRALCPQEGG